MDVELLSRIQFALTVTFHYFFPPISIGLGLLLVFMEGMYLRTKDPLWERLTRFWVKIFAIVFAVGVASGIVMEFQFGTNWATYSRYVGDIFGSALAAEGVFAFFLESGFLAVLVFGWNRVTPKVHFLSTVLVCLGSTFSAVWIVVANSWMHTPAGFVIEGTGLAERARITDFWAMVFNPSAMIRLAHVVAGSWATGAFLVISVAAFYLLKKRHQDFAVASMKVAVPLAILAVLLQPVLGHFSVEVVAEHQPAKLAAFEGHYDSTRPMDLYLLGWTNPETEMTVGLALPGMASFLLAGSRETAIKGLDQVPLEDRPPVAVVFQAYHLMVAMGMAMIVLALVTAFKLRRGTLAASPKWLKLLVPAVLLPHIANLSGWYAAEMGRQPWIVQDMLRTSEALSKAVKAEQVLGSIVMFLLVYGLLFCLFVFLIDTKIKEGPTDSGTDSAPGQATVGI
ncbi:MAG: cytochrome ubiquinol oxidase subunit I [Fimbriimonadaceae bacterium]